MICLFHQRNVQSLEIILETENSQTWSEIWYDTPPNPDPIHQLGIGWKNWTVKKVSRTYEVFGVWQTFLTITATLLQLTSNISNIPNTNRENTPEIASVSLLKPILAVKKDSNFLESEGWNFWLLNVIVYWSFDNCVSTFRHRQKIPIQSHYLGTFLV